MGLFDKKYCDICGEKIGLLGNRKLENGNLCKKTVPKSSRRGSLTGAIAPSKRSRRSLPTGKKTGER